MTKSKPSAARTAGLTERMSRALIFLIAACCGTARLPAAEVTISNDRLEVRLDTALHAFSVQDLAADRLVIPVARFARQIRVAASVPLLDPIWGKGSEIRVIHVDGWQSSLRIFEHDPFVQIETRAWNAGETPIASDSEEILALEADLGVPAEGLRAYGTGGLHWPADAPGSFTFAALVDPRSRRGIVAAFLTHDHGSGVFFTDVADGRARLRARVDFGRFEVRPGSARTIETLVVGSFQDARLGLEAYADAVARQLDIRLPPMPSVYCSWYHAGSSDEDRMIANGEFVREHLLPYGLSVLQIDDHWQRWLPAGVDFDGDTEALRDGGPVKVFVEANDRFPNGMAYTARRLAAMGLVPGIWFMPFAGNWKNPYYADLQENFARTPEGKPFTTRWSGTILDMSNPRAQSFVRERVRRIADWGYRYFKLDGMHTGAVCHNVYVNDSYSTSGRYQNRPDLGGGILHDTSMTHIEAYRRGLQIVREAAGPDVFILGCNVSQNMRSMGPAFGLIDAMRIGPDNGGAGRGQWNQVTVGPRHGTNLYFLNRRVWHNDPDPVYVRPSNPLQRARVMVSWVALSGSMVTTSYQFAELPPERLDLLRRCIPSHRAIARPVDLFEEELARIWLVTGETGEARRHVVGLFNWNETRSAEIRYDLARLGLDGDAEYVAFDFWADRFVGSVRGELVETLPAASCRVLALRSRTDYPQVLSTSRHVTQGIVELLEESWDPVSRTLSGRSRVVAGDPYELRIALPPGRSWTVVGLEPGADAAIVRPDSGHGIRVRIDPEETGAIEWSVRFD